MSDPRRASLPPPAPWSPDFVDRVMAAVAQEPRPSPSRVLLRSLARLHFGDAWATVATAGHLALGRSGTIPALLRAQSLLLVLALGVTLGGGTLAAAGAIRVIEDRLQAPRVEQPVLGPAVIPSPAPTLASDPDASSSPPHDQLRDEEPEIGAGSDSAASRRRDREHDDPAPETGIRKRDQQSSDGRARPPDSRLEPSPGSPSRPNGSIREERADDRDSGAASVRQRQETPASPQPAGKRRSTPDD